MSHYKRYPEYKDSGVEWLGKVPAHWEVLSLRRVAAFKNSNVDKQNRENQEKVRLCNYTDVYYSEFIFDDQDFMVATASHEEIEKFGLSPFDVIITKDSEDPADIGIPTLVKEASDDLVCGYHLTLIRSGNNTIQRLLHRLLQSSVSRGYFFQECPGVTRYGLNQNSIGSLPVPLPPIPEAESICDHIDRETIRIDTLIKKKNRFIELLKERRLALITQAVTKGMDPDVPMKCSGVPAIGRIPAHWKTKPLRSEMSLKKETVGDNWEQYPLLSLTRRGIIFRDTSKNFGKFPESFETYQTVKNKDLVMCLFDIDETPRTVGLSRIEGMITGAYSVFSIKSDVYREYIYYLLIHLDDAKGMKPYYSGLRKTIRPSRLLGIHFPFPPKEEAKAICEHINKSTGRIDKLITKTQISIDLLKEHRAALITAAVTGKIDLRDENGKEAA